jgi:hypothetical protein
MQVALIFSDYSARAQDPCGNDAVDKVVGIIPPVVTYEFVCLLNSVTDSRGDDAENADEILCLVTREYTDA